MPSKSAASRISFLAEVEEPDPCQNVPRRKGGFVMFSVQSNSKTAQESDVTSGENLAGFRKAALVAVSQ
jgi:hypothetical protein